MIKPVLIILSVLLLLIFINTSIKEHFLSNLEYFVTGYRVPKKALCCILETSERNRRYTHTSKNCH